MASTETSIPRAQELHAKEREYWNGEAGQYWVLNQERVDAFLAPVAAAAVDRAHVAQRARVIDVGCGCGVTSFELARRAGPEGAVIGLDISAPMLERAQACLPAGLRVDFILDDAAAHPFAREAYDLLFSRFGVMFFGEPAAAFANMRRALRPAGRLVFACWRDRKENPWMLVPLHAAYEHVPPLPRPEPEDPGPFSLASEARVRRILQEAGFTDVILEALDFDLDLANGNGLDNAVSFAIEIGATSRAVRGQPETMVEAARQAVRRALTPYVKGSSVALPAAVWLVSASNP